MNVCSFTDLRKRLRQHLDEVHRSRTPLLVTRQGHAPVVVLDKEEYDGIMETFHLLRSPKNAERLLDAASEADASDASVKLGSVLTKIGRRAELTDEELAFFERTRSTK